MKKVNIVLLGPPGSGKGEQSKLLEKEFNLKIIYPGDLLRAEVEKRSSVGKKIAAVLSAGKLVDSVIADRMVKAHMKKKFGYVFDGYPREVREAKSLLSYATVTHVFVFDVPLPIILKRLAHRTVCQSCQKIYAKQVKRCSCGGKLLRRKDDHPSAIKRRLALYKKETMPVILFFQKNQVPVYHINGSYSIRKVFVSVKRILHQ